MTATRLISTSPWDDLRLLIPLTGEDVFALTVLEGYSTEDLVEYYEEIWPDIGQKFCLKYTDQTVKKFLEPVLPDNPATWECIRNPAKFFKTDTSEQVLRNTICEHFW